MQTNIKRITVSNWKDFKNIRLEAFRSEKEAFSTSIKEAEGYADEYWKDMLKDSNNIVLLALVEGKVVGIIRSALKDEEVEDGIAFVGSFYVNSNYRRMGIGKMLMKELIEIVYKQEGIFGMRLWVNKKQVSAIGIYKAFGFKEVGIEKEELILEKRFS